MINVKVAVKRIYGLYSSIQNTTAKFTNIGMFFYTIFLLIERFLYSVSLITQSTLFDAEAKEFLYTYVVIFFTIPIMLVISSLMLFKSHFMTYFVYFYWML